VPFFVPSYQWWESPFYGIGLRIYDMLAGRFGFGKSSHVSASEMLAALPSLNPEGLLGGTKYYDGQFDDARLAINLATTAAEHGATLVNYARVEGFSKDSSGHILGVEVQELESQESFLCRAQVVVNATGPFADSLRQIDDPTAKKIIAPSQGVHLVLDHSFLPNDAAIMVPHTDDGRLLFAIPWHGVAVIGTTDTAIDESVLEPKAQEEEIDFILENANRYLKRRATRSDVRSVFTGIRPLVQVEKGESTAALSREHAILINPESGLLTVAGGKWTTYRKMAEDVVDQAATLAGLQDVPCPTRRLKIHGHHALGDSRDALAIYGSDARKVRSLIGLDVRLGKKVHEKLPLVAAEVIWATRFEMARRVEDVLARRTRCLLLDARAAAEAAPRVADLMAQELGFDSNWVKAEVEAFQQLAQDYLPSKLT
ncbi:MAG: FAD-dependent oxidoreductase, partial [Polyangiaceae bacterium]|nr:FAD-dependent oxidoreductase [Polyangiaceae bacterium]